MAPSSPRRGYLLAGYKDPHLPLLSRDSPVLSRAGLRCILQWATSLKIPLFSGDCKSAFLQGAADEERGQAIFMRAPSVPVSLQAVEKSSEKRLLYKLSTPVYGQATAPAQALVCACGPDAYQSWLGSSHFGSVPVAAQRGS